MMQKAFLRPHHHSIDCIWCQMHPRTPMSELRQAWTGMPSLKPGDVCHSNNIYHYNNCWVNYELHHDVYVVTLTQRPHHRLNTMPCASLSTWGWVEAVLQVVSTGILDSSKCCWWKCEITPTTFKHHGAERATGLCTSTTDEIGCPRHRKAIRKKVSHPCSTQQLDTVM